jgi:RimJ/RimL family protein N-acetyltransferase
MWSMTRLGEPKPLDGMIELDGDSLRRITTDDLPALMRLRDSAPPNLFELPGSPAQLTAFLEALDRRPWSMPLLCCRRGRPTGVCLMNVGQLKNLNAYLVALFEEPATAERLLGLYIRQAFWAYPLHRLYAQLARHDELQPHIDLLRRSGFQSEGVLVAHINPGGADAADAVVLGLLREEFDGWCAENEPRLSLT